MNATDLELGASSAFGFWALGHSPSGAARPATLASRFAKRTSLMGKPICGRLGKPTPCNHDSHGNIFVVTPCIHDFHAKKILYASNRNASTLSNPSKMLTFHSQVPDLTLFNLFYPQTPSQLPLACSTLCHQKSPAIPPIPLNSTYADRETNFPYLTPECCFLLCKYLISSLFSARTQTFWNSRTSSIVPTCS